MLGLGFRARAYYPDPKVQGLGAQIIPTKENEVGKLTTWKLGLCGLQSKLLVFSFIRPITLPYITPP